MYNDNSIRATLLQYEKDISSIRIENGKYHVEAMKMVSEVKQQIDEFNSEKDKFVTDFKKIQELNDSQKELKKECTAREKGIKEKNNRNSVNF